MNLEYILGKMEECTKVSTKRTKSMDLEYIHGPIKSDMQVGGQMESSMVLEFSYHAMARRKWECGKMAASSDGFQITKLLR